MKRVDSPPPPLSPTPSLPGEYPDSPPASGQASASSDADALALLEAEAIDAPPPMAGSTPPPPAPAAGGWGLGSAWSAVSALGSATYGSVNRYNPAAVALRQALFPGAYGYISRDVTPGKGAEVRRLTTVLDGTVDMRAYKPLLDERNHVAIVGFHGNGCTADSMHPMWNGFREFGHVFGVNLPGYGQSSVPDDGMDLELHIGATVQAVRDHLLHELGFAARHIVWYGLSLGGSAAAVGFSMLPGSHLFVQNTFTSVADVAGNVLSKSTLGRFGPSVASLAAASALPSGLERPNLLYVTDCLNTAHKLQTIRAAGKHARAGSRLLVVGAGEDALMAPSFPSTLAHSFYGDDVPDDRLHVVAGATHNSPIHHDVDAIHKIRGFLQNT